VEAATGSPADFETPLQVWRKANSGRRRTRPCEGSTSEYYAREMIPGTHRTWDYAASQITASISPKASPGGCTWNFPSPSVAACAPLHRDRQPVSSNHPASHGCRPPSGRDLPRGCLRRVSLVRSGSVIGDTGGQPKTSVSHSRLHGVGLRILERAVGRRRAKLGQARRVRDGRQERRHLDEEFDQTPQFGTSCTRPSATGQKCRCSG